MSIRGLLVGVLVLAGIEVVLSSEAGAARFGGLLTGVGSVVRHFLDPTVPAIPDLRDGGGVTHIESLGPAGQPQFTPQSSVNPPPRHAPVVAI